MPTTVRRAHSMSKRLSGKVCIITGTGGGMGREAALTFAREGALVVGCGLYVDDAEATAAAGAGAGGRNGSPAPRRLTDPGSRPALVDIWPAPSSAAGEA